MEAKLIGVIRAGGIGLLLPLIEGTSLPLPVLLLKDEPFIALDLEAVLNGLGIDDVVALTTRAAALGRLAGPTTLVWRSSIQGCGMVYALEPTTCHTGEFEIISAI